MEVFKNMEEQEVAGFYEGEDYTINNCSPELWNSMGGNYEKDILDPRWNADVAGPYKNVLKR